MTHTPSAPGCAGITWTSCPFSISELPLAMRGPRSWTDASPGEEPSSAVDAVTHPCVHADADLKANFRHALVASEGKQQTGRSQDQCPDSFFHPELVTQGSDIS